MSLAAALIGALAVGAGVYFYATSNGGNDHVYCKRHQADCWPTQKQINDFYGSLVAADPDAKRHLTYKGPGHTQPGPGPIGDPTGQPLFGLGDEQQGHSLDVLYVMSDGEAQVKCFSSDAAYTDQCKAETRNQPYYHWRPGFVVYVTQESQVKLSLEFALNHNLCVMVAGTGHEFLNRHSCPSEGTGVFIRTSLLKKRTFLPKWDLNPTFAPDGAFQVGPGNTFSELHTFASENKRLMASGWCMSVGIPGWSLGGGHGPFTPSAGFGSANLLEMVLYQVADRNGKKVVERVVANEKDNSDVYWAVRGGGGGTWGAIVQLTTRAHALPAPGITMVNLTIKGTFCDNAQYGHNREFLHRILAEWSDWALTLNRNYGGFFNVNPVKTQNAKAGTARRRTHYGLVSADYLKWSAAQADTCNATWKVIVQYFYKGPQTDEDFKRTYAEIAKILDVKNGGVEWILPMPEGMWDYVKQPIETPDQWPIVANFTQGEGSPLNVYGQSSVLINKSFVKDRSKWHKTFTHLLDQCYYRPNQPGGIDYCPFTYVFVTNTPAIPGTALSHGMMDSFLHNDINGGYTQKELDETLYSLGENSYFSESAFYMPNWQKRYWGEENYRKLLEVKKKRDPFNIFWCHHCIGDTSST